VAFPEFYAEIRSVHIAAALASGTLFFLRGAVLFSGRQWALAAPVRYLAMGIDTVLLAAAVALTTIVRQYPLVDAWLTAKVALLVLYIGLGLVAFWKGRSRGVRVCAWAAALVVFAAIYSVARAHHPLGLLR
jgi:uncharacterized membrane protein SirB2